MPLRRKGEAKDLIARLLGEPARCFTTPCVQAELKALGKEFQGGLLGSGRAPARVA